VYTDYCSRLYLTEYLYSQRVQKSIICVELECKAADEVAMTILLILLFEKNKQLAVKSNNLINNFPGLVASGRGMNVARGPPVVSC
jgi:hypothetical protein